MYFVDPRILLKTEEILRLILSHISSKLLYKKFFRSFLCSSSHRSYLPKYSMKRETV